MGKTGTRPGGRVDKSGGFAIIGGAIGGYSLVIDRDIVSFQVYRIGLLKESCVGSKDSYCQLHVDMEFICPDS